MLEEHLRAAPQLNVGKDQHGAITRRRLGGLTRGFVMRQQIRERRGAIRLTREQSQ
jgi:hypothetical protein